MKCVVLLQLIISEHIFLNSLKYSYAELLRNECQTLKLIKYYLLWNKHGFCYNVSLENREFVQ